MYRDQDVSAPDEVLCFMVRTVARAGFSVEHGTGEALADINHMQQAVNARLQQGFWVRSVKPCALDAEHALVTFVLARIPAGAAGG